MKLSKKLAAVITSIALITPFTFADVPNENTIQDGLTAFAKEILVAAPQASTQQNVWSDAYIGNLPLKFGFGITAGGTKIDNSGLKTALDEFGVGTAADMVKVLPVASIDVRLGGIILPFDVGISAMMTNPNLFAFNYSDPTTVLNTSQNISFDMGGLNFSYDYLTIGFDVRYRILQENVVVPKISIGAGYYYTKSAIGLSYTQSATNYMKMNVAYNTEVIFAQAQISKNIAFVNLFAGGRAIVPKTVVNYGYDYLVTYNSETLADKTYNATVTKDNVSTAYQDSKFDFSMVEPQLYAGVSFNFLVFQTTLSASCDVRSFFDSENYEDALWSAALSIHVDL